MSWMQWQGETLPNTNNCAKLELRLHAPDMGGPRQNWRFDLGHEVLWPDDGVKRKYRRQRWLSVEIEELGIAVGDVRELSGMVIRSTPEWLLRVQECGQYGRLVEPVVRINHSRVSEVTEEYDAGETFLSVEWELRFGQAEEMSLPCELDVWAPIPEQEFFRMEPETAAELARFAEGEPALRVMARADIISASVEMERCGDDPVPLARQRLREAVRGLEGVREKVFWENNYVTMPDHKAVTEPGWRSSVRFETGL